MSQAGDLHKKMMRQMDCADLALLDLEAHIEQGDCGRDELLRNLRQARRFLSESGKMALRLDTGEVEV
jgi:hypothetical protein